MHYKQEDKQCQEAALLHAKFPLGVHMSVRKAALIKAWIAESSIPALVAAKVAPIWKRTTKILEILGNKHLPTQWLAIRKMKKKNVPLLYLT